MRAWWCVRGVLVMLGLFGKKREGGVVARDERFSPTPSAPVNALLGLSDVTLFEARLSLSS